MATFTYLTLQKICGFGMEVNVESVDGHNLAESKTALESCAEDAPTCIIANTVKGKGVSFMKNNNLWHYRDPQGADYDNAIIKLEAQRP